MLSLNNTLSIYFVTIIEEENFTPTNVGTHTNITNTSPFKANDNRESNKLSTSSKHHKISSLQTNKQIKNTTTDAEGENQTPNHLKIEGQRNNNQDNSDILVVNMSIKQTPHKSFKANNKDKDKTNKKKSNNNDNLNDNSDNNIKVSSEQVTKIRKDFFGNKITKKGRKHKISFIDIIKQGKLEDIVNIRKIEDIEESFEDDEIKKKNSDKKSNHSKNSKSSNHDVKNKNTPKLNGVNQSDENCSCACAIF